MRWFAVVLTVVFALSLSGCSSSGSIGGQLNSQRFDQIGTQVATIAEATRQLVGLAGWENAGDQAIPDAPLTVKQLSVGTSANAGVNCVNWRVVIFTRGDVDSVALKQKLTGYWESLGLSVGYIKDDTDTGEFYIVGRGSGDSVIESVGVELSDGSTPPTISVDVEAVCVPGEYGPTVRSVNGSPDAG